MTTPHSNSIDLGREPDEAQTVIRSSNTSDLRGAHGVIIQMEAKWTALALVMSGIALGLSIMVVYVQATAYHELEREIRLEQLKTDDFAVALKARGIDPTPSHEGNAP